MANDALQITNLLYRYTELMDEGRLAECAALFDKAGIKTAQSAELLNSDQLLALWQTVVKIHPCGTPRTKHVCTNPIIEIDEAAGTATARSYYTIFQSTDILPLQVIGNGRYHDEFTRIDGKWHYTYRDYSLFDAQGDLSDHVDMVKVLALTAETAEAQQA